MPRSRRFPFACALALSLCVTMMPRAKAEGAEEGPPWPYLNALEKATAGQRVFAVGSAEAVNASVAPAIPAGASLEENLRAVGEAASGMVPLVPVRAGEAWVLAPETRETASTEARPLDLAERVDAEMALQVFFSRLSPEEARLLGSSGGLPATDLSPEARRALVAALRPPLRLVELQHGKMFPNADMDVRKYAFRAWVRRPIDWSRVRLHAYLQGTHVVWDLTPKATKATKPAKATRPGTPRATRSIIASVDGPDVPDGTLEFRVGNDQYIAEPYDPEAPFFPRVPNTPKPSDLEGTAYAQPLGIKGITSVDAVVKQVAKVTGLALHAAEVYRDVPAFVGSEALTCGEAIDGLRLALPAAWRKLGEGYILAWDREGAGPAMLKTMSAWADVFWNTEGGDITQRKIDTSPAWLALAKFLPFAPNDPLAPTAVQRAKIIAESAKLVNDPAADRTMAWPRKIPFAELTPAQKAWARNQVVDRPANINIIGTPSSHATRKLTEAEFRTGALSLAPRVRLALEAPEWGRAVTNPVPLTFRRLYPKPGAPAEWVSDEEAARQALERTLKAQAARPASMNVGGPFVAAMVPPLSPERLKSLAGEMKAHGLNTLFYPLLFDGYATFPTPAFPLHPALSGENGWAAAVEAAKSAGIVVAGYLDTLTWRRHGEAGHWLDGHPDWLDRDILGRTSGEYLVGYPAPPPDTFGPAPLVLDGPLDFVRPAEPAVAGRLLALLGDFATQPGARAVAFAHWTPAFPAWYGVPVMRMETGRPADSGRATPPPPLGFAVPERLARVAAGKDDPVDILSQLGILPAGLSVYRQRQAQREASTEDTPPDPYSPLLARLLRTAKEKGWTTYVVNDAPGANPELVPTFEADAFIGPSFPEERAPLLIPIWRKGAPEAGPMRDFNPLAVALARLKQMTGEDALPSPLPVLFDFRAAPEDITAILGVLMNAEDAESAEVRGGE